MHHVLEDPGAMSLLNDVSLPIHLRQGRLDLALVATCLQGRSGWSLNPTLTSDPFGILLHLRVDTVPPPQRPPLRYNTCLAD